LSNCATFTDSILQQSLTIVKINLANLRQRGGKRSERKIRFLQQQRLPPPRYYAHQSLKIQELSRLLQTFVFNNYRFL
jgi:hypothetical protein